MGSEPAAAGKPDVAGQTDRRALLLLIGGSLSISFAPIFIRLAAVEANAAGFWRMLFASLSLLLVLLLRRESLRISRSSLLWLGGAGTLLALDFMCWHRSIYLVGPGLATLLGNLQIFFTALFCWLLLRQQPGRWFWLAVFMAIGGLVLITGAAPGILNEQLKWGIIFGLLTALLYSGYILMVKQAMRAPELGGMQAMLAVAISSMLVLAVGTHFAGETYRIPNASSLLALIAVGVICSTLGWSLITTGIKQVPATLASLVLLLQPLLAFVWDVLIFNRPAGISQLAGLLLLIVAMYFGTLKHVS